MVFLLSPANCAGKRAKMLLERVRTISLAAQLNGPGATLGEVFTFMSSLYFRGKLAYANAFGVPPDGWPAALVIAPGRGLLPADLPIRTTDLQGMAGVEVDSANPLFREPLIRDAHFLEQALGAEGRAVLLGSIATEKYATPLIEVLGGRLHFPATFVGRGDMSRGGLLLRAARTGQPLECVPVRGAVRRGKRPEKLPKIRRQTSDIST
jgi:hypothetical protein